MSKRTTGENFAIGFGLFGLAVFLIGLRAAIAGQKGYVWTGGKSGPMGAGQCMFAGAILALWAAYVIGKNRAKK